MELYLVQHGRAESSEGNPSRPLTLPGRKEVARISTALTRIKPPVEAIYHSGRLRAEQTAEMLGDSLAPSGGILQLAGLNPNDDPAIAESQLHDLSGPVMLVGHLPHLSRLTSLLLVGDARREIVAYRNAGVVCLRSNGADRWQVAWYLLSELLGRG